MVTRDGGGRREGVEKGKMVKGGKGHQGGEEEKGGLGASTDRRGYPGRGGEPCKVISQKEAIVT